MVKLEKSNDHNTEDYVFPYSNTRVYFSPNICRNLLISIYNSKLNVYIEKFFYCSVQRFISHVKCL